MGLFSDKIFATPIKNLVSLSSWSNGGGNNSLETGRGNASDRNEIVENNDDGRTPPSPSPPSPQFTSPSLSLQSSYQTNLLQQPLRNVFSSYCSNNSTLVEQQQQQTFSPLSIPQSSSMSLPSPTLPPLPPSPSSDFIQFYSNSNNKIKKNGINCSSFDGHYNNTLQNKNNIATTTATTKNCYKMHQNQAINIKSIRRSLSKDDSSSSCRQKALKAVLTELQNSLALAKTKTNVSNHYNDNNMMRISKTKSATEITDKTKIQKSKGVPFIVTNSNEILSEISKLRNDDDYGHSNAIASTSASASNVSSFTTKKNYFMNRTKYCNNNSNNLQNEDEESGSGSASMQQLSTSWEFIKLEKRPILVTPNKDTNSDKDEQQQDVAPPRFIKVMDGKISLGPPNISDNNKEKEILERRVLELESSLQRVQDQLNHSQCGSPTLEKDLKEQLESMNRTIKSKERKAAHACRDYKALQARFSRQESILQTLQQENKQLQQRVRQYEHCLDDVMRKVVDALVNEDSLREEVSMLKSRVKDLEAQNAALSASPAKGKDEGYCTMSSGQPQPSNSHLEDLPEEPEQWLLAAEPCSAEMEDWSMSQDELGVITLDDDGNENEHDWIWNSSYLNSTMIDSQSEGITQLLRETIVYSDDEELTCTDFTRDFYKLVNIPSGSTRSLYSHMDAETDDEDDDDDDDDGDDDDDDDDDEENNDNNKDIHINDDNIDNNELSKIGQNNNLSNGSNNSNSDKKLNNRTTKNKKSGPSPTPSEAGRALVTSCSSSESEIGLSTTTTNSFIQECVSIPSSYDINDENSTILTNNKINLCNNKIFKSDLQSSLIPHSGIRLKEISMPSTSYNCTTTSNSVWRKSNGWKRMATTSPKKEEHPSIKKQLSPLKKSKIPPPVPVRRSYAS